jgi:16S rRNA processing protein RimM
MKSKAAGDRIAIGRLGAPKGVKGDIKIHSYSGEFAHFLKLKEVELVSTGAVARKLRLKVARAEASTDVLTMAFEGYPSPETVRVLTGMEIMVGPEGIAPLRENEWYIADLIGLRFHAGDREFGTVESILEGGPELWLEVRLPAGGTAVVPFKKEFVGEVDVAGGRIELLAPEILE